MHDEDYRFVPQNTSHEITAWLEMVRAVTHKPVKQQGFA